jgi:hypothetical protein
VDLTSRLLTQCGQGPNCQNQATKHTPFSLQVVTLLVFLFFFEKFVSSQLPCFCSLKTDMFATNVGRADDTLHVFLR